MIQWQCQQKFDQGLSLWQAFEKIDTLYNINMNIIHCSSAEHTFEALYELVKGSKAYKFPTLCRIIKHLYSKRIC